MTLHQIYQPHPALKSHVMYYWSLDLQFGCEAMLNLQLMADRYPRIVIQCLNGRNALHGFPNTEVPAASLKGISSRPVLVQMEPIYSHVAVSLFPYGLKALFGVDADETTDSVLDLCRFISSDHIEKIMLAPNHAKRIELLENLLLKRLTAINTIDWRVVNFVHHCSRVNYGSQLKDYGISERQFERKFLQAVGFTPSYYKRVLRFEKALTRIQHSQFKSFADLVYELGYADQSHFNREFKQFSALTPTALLSKHKIIEESGSIVVE